MTEQHKAWGRYLADHKVFSNPFTQHNWQNYPKTILTAYRVDVSKEKMKFTLAKSTRNIIKSQVNNHLSFDQRNKDNQAIQVISCLPGGGKSRLLQELSSILDDCGLDAIYLATFDHPSNLCDKDTINDNKGASRAIAMRLLFQAVRLSDERERARDLQYGTWFSELTDLGLEPIDDIHEAIRYMGGDPTKKCVIAVDEVNRILEDVNQMQSGISTGMEVELSSKAMGQLFKALGFAMVDQKSQAVSFIAGTLISTFAEAAIRSGFRAVFTILAPLSYLQQSIILDNIPELQGWRRSRDFKVILASLGGVPRLLEWFTDEVLQHLKGRSWASVVWDSVGIAITGALNGHRYMWRVKSMELAQALVDIIILRRPILSLSQQVVPGTKTKDTYESLQATGQILLQEQPEGFYVTMPLLTFRGLVYWAINSEDPSARRFKYVHQILISKVTLWQDLEVFGYYHSAMMNGFFAVHTQYSQQFDLSDRYAFGLGGGGQVAVKLINRVPDHVKWGVIFPGKEGETQPSTSLDVARHFADGNCYLNGPSASCWDAWYVCSQVGNRTIPASRVLVAEQYKQRAKLSFNDCRKEHAKNLKAWENASIERKEDYRIVTIVIACCHVTPPSIEDDQDKDLLVVDNEKLSDLYGILRPLLKIARIGYYDINTMGDEELRKFFGGDMGRAVVRLRGPAGFESPTKLYERLNADGVEVKDFDKVNGMDF